MKVINPFTLRVKRSISNIIRIGIQLAKSSVAICGVDEYGKVVLRKTLTRPRLFEFFANVPATIVAMAAGAPSGLMYTAGESDRNQ